MVSRRSDSIFMLDGTPSHRSSGTRRCQDHLSDIWGKDTWLGDSPGLNPIELFWRIVQQELDIYKLSGDLGQLGRALKSQAPLFHMEDVPLSFIGTPLSHVSAHLVIKGAPIGLRGAPLSCAMRLFFICNAPLFRIKVPYGHCMHPYTGCPESPGASFGRRLTRAVIIGHSANHHRHDPSLTAKLGVV